MDINAWTKQHEASYRDEERRRRALAAYEALRGADGGVLDVAVESRSSRGRLLDRLLRRELAGAPVPAKPAV